ncbi:MAG: AMP-binding protein [Actinomycetota bacterium]|nr:AMP-binding protein [Actinomycetota bacterium]MDD5667545.1 AMP-binding protein [Actinomycetota bacterium]
MGEKNPALMSNMIEMRLEENPDKVGLIFENGGLYPDEPLTYREIAASTFKMARAYREFGLRKGDAVATLMRNHPESVFTTGAATLLGMIAVPIDPRTKGEKLGYMLQDCKAKGIITTADLLPEVESVVKNIPGIERIWLNLKPDADPDLAKKYPTINEILAGPDVFEVEGRIDDPNLPMAIIYTSGVTGNPKGVVIKSTRTAMFAQLAPTLIWKYTPETVIYTGLSLTHGNALAISLLPALSMGILGVISQRFTKSRIWDICRKYGCTTFSLLGGMMAGIYNEPPKPDDADNPVEVVISAGTPAPIWEPFEKRFGVKILEWYGAVEGGFAYNPIGVGPIGSFGKPLEGIQEAIVVDENDNEVSPGVTGELLMRAVNVKPEVEYYGREKDSQDKTRGGWLRTGDMVHKDEEGWLYFDYRKEGGGLRRAGDFIIPTYVEKVIGEHPDISEVCVYGIPAASGAPGESDLVAAVAPFEGKAIDPASVFQTAKDGLEPNSVPSYIQVVNEIPKSASEKHLDRVLKDEFSEGADNVFKLEDYS